MLSLFLLVFALVLFLIGAFVNPVDPWRGKLLCLGLVCLIIWLLGGFGSVHGLGRW